MKIEIDNPTPRQQVTLNWLRDMEDYLQNWVKQEIQSVRKHGDQMVYAFKRRFQSGGKKRRGKKIRRPTKWDRD